MILSAKYSSAAYYVNIIEVASDASLSKAKEISLWRVEGKR